MSGHFYCEQYDTQNVLRSKSSSAETLLRIRLGVAADRICPRGERRSVVFPDLPRTFHAVAQTHDDHLNSMCQV